MIVLAIIGALIAFVSFMSGVVIYSAAKSAIHEIYAALLMITAMLGLLMTTAAACAARLRRAIEDSEDTTAKELRAVAEGIRLIAAERPGDTSGALASRIEPRLIAERRPPAAKLP